MKSLVVLEVRGVYMSRSSKSLVGGIESLGKSALINIISESQST